MATIAISDLNTPGLDLFQDSESFLNELTEDELNMTRGGWWVKILWSAICFGG